MDTVVDRIGRHRQIFLQYEGKYHLEAVQKTFCKDTGILFKQDLCKADREAHAAAWPKLELARTAGKTVFFRGHVRYISGNWVTLD